MNVELSQPDLRCSFATPICPTSRHAGVVQILIDAQANVNDIDQYGRTALHKAVDGSERKVARLLIENSAVLDAKDGWGDTALLVACDNGDRRMAEMLLDSGANVRSRDLLRATSLHKASQAGRTRLVQLLLENGADPAAKDLHGNTPLDLSVAEDNLETSRLLEQAGAAPHALRITAEDTRHDAHGLKKDWEKMGLLLSQGNESAAARLTKELLVRYPHQTTQASPGQSRTERHSGLQIF